jgi:hypothetical protein
MPAVLAAMLITVFGVCVLSAIVASVLIHLTGWVIGVPSAAVVIWVGAVWPRTGVIYRLYGLLRLTDAPADESPRPVAATA